jgi:hypothetical protein
MDRLLSRPKGEQAEEDALRDGWRDFDYSGARTTDYDSPDR